MRILYLSQYFPPEIGATQSRALAMARGIVRAGHRVTVVTEFPNHPEGIIPARYRGKLRERESLDGIDVLRVPVWASPRKTLTRRLGFYVSYAAAAVVGGLLERGRFDVVFATSPPLFAAAAGATVATLRRTPFVLEIRDAWPESAVQLGELHSARAIRWSRRLERGCLRRARRVVTVTDGLRRRLLDGGVPGDRVVTIPNGADPSLFRPSGERAALRECLGIPGDAFVVLYAGLHGLAHGLETVLEAADRLRDDPAVLFLMVGAGPRKAAIEALAAERALRHVRFHDAVAEEELPAWFAAADVGLDVRRRIGITAEALPVKMFAAMACERPVLLAIEGEAAELVTRSGAGVVVPPEDASALADAIRALRADPVRCAAMGRRGRSLVERDYDRAKLAKRLVRVLEDVGARAGS